MIIQIRTRISSLPYLFDVDALKNVRFNGMQINHSVKITNHNRYNISKEF